MGAIASHYSEAHIRAKFVEYTSRFVLVASRYEEEVTGSTTVGYPSLAYTERPGEKPRLGSGVYFPDDVACARELAVNAGRIEGWRRTECYRLLQAVSGASQPHFIAPLVLLLKVESRTANRCWRRSLSRALILHISFRG